LQLLDDATLHGGCTPIVGQKYRAKTTLAQSLEGNIAAIQNQVHSTVMAMTLGHCFEQRTVFQFWEDVERASTANARAMDFHIFLLGTA
jgi:hypothetical protein